MVSPKRQIVIPIPRPQLVSPPVNSVEQPKAFQFAVSWRTLLAQLQVVEVRVEPVAVEIVPRETAARALQVVDPPPLPPEDEPAWEMVVPKMIRRPS